MNGEYGGSNGLTRPLSPGDYLLAAATALAALAVYVVCLPPTVTGDDSGELIAAAYTLGIPHPHGYPLWCLTAHPFTWIPWATVATRVALASAFYAAAAAGLVALLVRSLARSPYSALAAASAGLALAFSREFWEQAIIAEVYALNALCIALCLLTLWRWHSRRLRGEPHADRLLYGFALVYGLSLGNHYTMVVLGPVFALFIIAVHRRPWRHLGTYGGMMALAFGAAFLVFLYLPLRSLADPPVDWANPETLENWWLVVRRKQYAFMFSQYERDLGRFLRQLAVYGRFWLREFTPWTGGVGLAGLFLLVRRRPGYGLLLLVAGLLVPAAFSYVQNFNFTREWYWVMSVFGIPTYMMTAIGLGVALDTIACHRGGRWLALPLAIVCVASPLLAHHRHNDLSAYYWAEDYARNMLEPLPPDALYFPDTDHGAFPALYLQVVEDLRPDITMGRKYGYVDMALAESMPADRRRVIGEFPKRRYEPEIFAWILEHDPRPAFFARPVKLPEEAQVRFVPAGLLWQALRPGELPVDKDWWEAYRWHTLAPEDIRGDHTAALVVYEYHLARARDAFRAGNQADALAHVAQATAPHGPDADILNNAGVVCARYGAYDAAAAYFRQALERAPAHEAAANNLSRVRRLRPDKKQRL